MAVAGAISSKPALAQTPKTMRVGVHKGVVFVPSLLLESLLAPTWKVELSYFVSPADMANARQLMAGSFQRRSVCLRTFLLCRLKPNMCRNLRSGYA